MTAEKQEEGLKRVIGIPSLAASVVNFTIGAGIYALPALIGIELGSSAVIGYALCGLMFAAIILCYVEIGSKVEGSGGSYAYVQAAFGPFAGFVVNWLFFFAWGILGDAAIVNVGADSLAVLFPALRDESLHIFLLLGMAGVMIVVNVLSTKLSVRFVNMVAMVKLIPLLLLIVFGLGYVHTDLLRIEKMPSLKSFDNAALLLFFAFAGFETSLNVSGEIKNPRRTIPYGVLLGGITVLVIFLFLQTITQGVLGGQLEQYKDAPLSSIAEKIGGTVAASLLLVAAFISCFGSVYGDVLSSSRLLFAGARSGLFPKFLARIHGRFQTPHLAVSVYGILIFIFSISGGFKKLAVLASGSLLLIYLAVVLALIRFRTKEKIKAEGSFKIPGGLLVPFIAIASILYSLSNLSGNEITSIAIFVAVVCVIYFVMKAFQRKAAKA